MKKLLAIAVLFGGLAEAQWTLPNTTANTSTVGFLDAGCVGINGVVNCAWPASSGGGNYIDGGTTLDGGGALNIGGQPGLSTELQVLGGAAFSNTVLADAGLVVNGPLTVTGSFKNGASGSTYTNQCDCAQGACQVLASGTSCTCTCSGCTTSSICYSSLIAADGGTTNAAEFGGATATCSVGTVTVTLGFTHALASQGNYNVHCNN